MLVCPDDGAVHEMERPVEPALGIGSPLQSSQDAIPHPSLLPSVEPARHGLPRAIALGQGAPRTTGTQDPEDAVEDGAVVFGGTTRVGLLRWKQRA